MFQSDKKQTLSDVKVETVVKLVQEYNESLDWLRFSKGLKEVLDPESTAREQLEDAVATSNPLMFAWACSDLGLAALLLDAGMRPDLPVNQRSDTLLHLAAFRGNDKLAQLLLDHGASMDARNAYGLTPRHIAQQMYSREVSNTFYLNTLFL